MEWRKWGACKMFKSKFIKIEGVQWIYLRFSTLLLLEPLGDVPPGLWVSFSWFSSKLDKFIFIETSLLESIGRDLVSDKGILCATGEVSDTLTSPVK